VSKFLVQDNVIVEKDKIQINCFDKIGMVSKKHGDAQESFTFSNYFKFCKLNNVTNNSLVQCFSIQSSKLTLIL